MNIEYTFKSGRLYAEGNERLRYKIRVPHIEGLEAINNLCDALVQECEIFCRDKLLEGDVGKRLKNGVRYNYSLDWIVTHIDSEVIGTVIAVRLRGGGESVIESFYASNFAVRDGMLIPPRDIIRAYRKKGQGAFDKDSFFLNNGELECLDGNAVKRLLASLKHTCVKNGAGF